MPRTRRLLALSSVSLVVLAAPSSALAHAELVSASPSDGAVLERAPLTISLRFSEPIVSTLGSIQVLDRSNVRVDTGEFTLPTSTSAATRLRRALPRGTYTVVWRVVSADSHPLSGSYVFGVGAIPTPPEPGAPSFDSSTPRWVSVAFGATRLLHYAALLAVLGGLFALGILLARAPAPVRRALWTAVFCACVVLALTSLAGIVLEGAAAGGYGLRDAAGWTVVRSVVGTRFGEVWAWQGVVAISIAVLAATSRQREDSALQLAAGALGVALVITPALAGHAGVSGFLAQAGDAVHLAAAAVWMGGLGFLALALALAGRERVPLAALAVPRFSRIALWSVVALALGGTINGLTQLGGVDALSTTSYGRLLVVKLSLVAILVGLGAYHRMEVPRLPLGVVAGELAVVGVILAITAVLVAKPPPKSSVTPTVPFTVETTAGPFALTLVVAQARAGANDLLIDLFDQQGEPASADQVRVSAQRVAARAGSQLVLGARPAGPGHYVVSDAQLSPAGTWRLRVAVLVGTSAPSTASVLVPIR